MISAKCQLFFLHLSVLKNVCVKQQQNANEWSLDKKEKKSYDI